MRLSVILLLAAGAAHAFVPGAVRPAVRSAAVGAVPCAAAPLVPQRIAAARVATTPVMGLFGLGAPELAIIGAVALLILGPDQVKKLAKDVGKVSAELKQVPEEFNKGMEVGAAELEAKKSPAVEAAEEGEAKPPSPPPSA